MVAKVLSGLALALALAPAAAAQTPHPATPVTIAASPATPPAGPSIHAEAVLAHVDRTIGWYHTLSSLEATTGSPDDAAFRNSLDQTALEALQLTFEFARAAAAILSEEKAASAAPAAAGSNAPAASSTASGDQTDRNLTQAAANIASRIAAAETQLSALNDQAARTPARARGQIAAERVEITAELNLAKEIQTTVQNLRQFAASTSPIGEAGQSLSTQIDIRERGVPEARLRAARATPGPAGAESAAGGRSANGSSAASSPASARPTDTATMDTGSANSLVTLVTRLITLVQERTTVSSAIRESNELTESIAGVQTPLTSVAREFVRQNTAAAPSSGTPDELIATGHSLDAAAARFKRLSTAIVPLAEQAILVDDARGALADRRRVLSGRLVSTGRILAVRLGLLALAVGAVLLISELWRRATFRYLRDSRRRHQFLMVRRIVVGCAIAGVVAMGFVSELGSLATYAGFVTAGLAVALQNVILAVVAYFFLIGRYGVRIGDRITLAGVTGTVIDLSLVRLYLMEVAGPDLHQTGRVVVFSNAILFQPAALFKQLPGTDYLWHTAKLTVAPETDIELARTRLTKAANEVYEKHRHGIDKQHAAFERAVETASAAPRPYAHLHYADSGIEFSVHYPVEIEHAAVVDHELLQALKAAAEQAPVITVTAAPSLQG